MKPLVAIDARDAAGAQLRGWGRYTRCLIDALGREPDLGLELALLYEGGRGPEVLYEQVSLPLELRRRHAALVHATNCFLPLVRSCPGVVTINDLAFETWPEDFSTRTGGKFRFFTRRAAHSAQLVICPSQYTADDVCARYELEAGKVRVIPDAPALAHGHEEPPAGPYVLAVGDLRRKKNLAALVEAYVVLRRERSIPHRLVLAGIDSGEGGRLRSIAGDSPLELPGYVSDSRLDALIRGADLLVHPSLYEGFGLVVLEAMVRDTPVLAARATALPGTGGDAAAYFEPAEDGSLREALGSLLADGTRRAELVARGREWARRFSWERTASATAAVYRELL